MPIMSELRVEHVRDLVEFPRVYDLDGTEKDWSWLKERYGDVRYLRASASDKFKLARVDITEGPAVIKVRVIDEEGRPVSRQPVVLYWPDTSLPEVPESYESRWAQRGVIQPTDSNGFAGFGLGNGSFYDPNAGGGPHVVWIGSPTFRSDGIAGVGMVNMTNHRGPLFLTFQRVSGEGQEEPQDDIQSVLGDIYGELLEMRNILAKLARHFGVLK